MLLSAALPQYDEVVDKGDRVLLSKLETHGPSGREALSLKGLAWLSNSLIGLTHITTEMKCTVLCPC